MADPKLYLRPIGFLYGDTAAEAVAEGAAFALAGGPISFTAAELIEGTPSSTERRLLAAKELAGSRDADLGLVLRRITTPRHASPHPSGLGYNSRGRFRGPFQRGAPMFARLMPHEGRFFDYFTAHAALIRQGAAELRAMLDNIGELEVRAHNIKTIESKADLVTHDTIQLLHQTFITPLDREDIHQLITRMDDILDLMEDVSHCVFLYDLRTVTDEAKRLADICVACAEKVEVAVKMLDNMANSEAITKVCGEIDRLETDADQVLRSGLAKLFRHEPDTRELIKMKEIYELLETVTDRCEDVANIIEGIVLENA